MPGKASQRKPHASPPPTVSGRWLAIAASASIFAAAVCAWAVLCLLFWQGSWQLLYRPSAAVTRTPASIGLGFDPVGFATTDAGEARLTGWWIPAEPGAPHSRYTVLFLHGQNGNLSDTVDALADLHSIGVNVFAIDYRGYGHSQFVHPSETHWHEDAEWALQYLTATRHIAANTIILVGVKLGANLSLEVSAQHPELAGMVLQDPLDAPVEAIFNDPRARLVPAHLLVRDRFDLTSSAPAVRIPSLWFLQPAHPQQSDRSEGPKAFRELACAKMLVWFSTDAEEKKEFDLPLSRWLDDLYL
jgi:hypothetical protein